MIVYPKDWKKDYSDFVGPNIDVDNLIDTLCDVLYGLRVKHLAYSGGIDSTVVLCLLFRLFDDISTYTISSRADHPDVLFARLGSEKYNTKHHEFIVEPTKVETDRFLGDNAVRQLFENIAEHTDEIICCDGIDEFMCGYYEHQNMKIDTYRFYLGRLTTDHLIPLHNSSKNVSVYLPYLDFDLIQIYRNMPLRAKVGYNNRKKIMVEMAKRLRIPKEFINRNKYGFCDAFREKDK